MDLISREALIREFENECIGECDKCPHELNISEGFCRLIVNTPTIEAVPAVHGEWIDDTGCLDSVRQYKCSKCGKKPIINSNWVSVLTDFCPNCGADMRKKV